MTKSVPHHLRRVAPLSEIFLRAAAVDLPVVDDHGKDLPEPPEPPRQIRRRMREAIQSRCRAIMAGRRQLLFPPPLSELMAAG